MLIEIMIKISNLVKKVFGKREKIEACCDNPSPVFDNYTTITRWELTDYYKCANCGASSSKSYPMGLMS